MDFFIDTADTTEIRRAAELGVLDGVTTNPSLVAKTGRPFDDVMKEIFSIVSGPISLEVVSEKADDMVEEGKRLREYGEQAAIKVPLTEEGLVATKRLTDEGIAVNVTLCFSSLQALAAAKAGATYISPFVGRLDDLCQDGIDLIGEIRQMYDNYDFMTRIIVASIRSPLHVRDSALIGADIATIPWKVFQLMIKHPLTDKGVAAFAKDWKKVPTS
ncbi:MAG: fructose-6-phosphate aldolase [Planctomycetota bacterium]|jgi:transaldolase